MAVNVSKAVNILDLRQQAKNIAYDLAEESKRNPARKAMSILYLESVNCRQTLVTLMPAV